MAMFQEEELKGSSPYEPFALNELEKGESVCFYFKETQEVTSPEYGEFTVMNGVRFDCSASTEEELEKSMKCISMPANTLLLNKIVSGVMRPGIAYRLEKAWNKGDKYDGNKKARGHGYKVFKLNASDELLRKFEQFVADKIGTSVSSISEEELSEEKPKPRI